MCVVILVVVQALRCIGDLVVGHPANRDILGSKVLGEEPDAEPALNCILRTLLKATNLSECIAAEYVIKCFCEVIPLFKSSLLGFGFNHICLLFQHGLVGAFLNFLLSASCHLLPRLPSFVPSCPPLSYGMSFYLGLYASLVLYRIVCLS